MKKIIFIALMLAPSVNASEYKIVPTVGASDARSLPHCVDQPDVIDGILNTERANAKSPYKYDGYKKELHSDSDVELVARLVYSESQAANCSENEKEIMPLIAQIIANRIKVRGEDVQSVVFQRDQFASSLNNYPESRFKDFLCPKDAALWALSLKAASDALNSSNKIHGMSSDVVYYYLYKNSERFKAPNWPYPEAQIPRSSSSTSCIRFFRNPTWK